VEFPNSLFHLNREKPKKRGGVGEGEGVYEKETHLRQFYNESDKSVAVDAKFFPFLFAKESEGVAGGGGGENLGHGGALGPGGNDRYVGTLPFLSLYIARVWSLI
jgi:hypothetical protein